MRSKTSPGMRLGWPGFRPSLLPFWNLLAGRGLAMAFPYSFPTLGKQSTTNTAPSCFVFALSDMLSSLLVAPQH